MKACELKHSTVNSASQHTSKVVRQWGSRTPRAVHHIPSSSIASVPGETTRRSWVVIKKGSIDNLQLRTEPLPAPSIGQATVEVKAIGLNFADVFSVLGLYSATPRGEFVPGLEFSGTVTALGPSKQTGEQLGATPPLQVGDAVVGVTRFGAYTSHINLALPYLRRMPAGWSYEEAAAYPVQTLTAAYALQELGAIKQGQAVLVHSAAGGVGLQALSLLAAKHARVLGTVSSQSKAAALQHHIRGKPFLQQQLAAADVLVRSPLGNGARFKQDLSDWLLRQGISGFDIILDSVQGRYFQPGYDTLAPTGRVVVFGAADLTPPPGADLSIGLSLLNPVKWPAIARLVYGYLTRPKVDPLKLPGDNKSVMGFNLIWLYQNMDLFHRLYAEMDALGLPPPSVGRTFEGLQQVPDALVHLQSGESMGKVVVRL